ncbi:hypothetical protein VTO58DRAFT_110328 [Aureobasidium pullulans]
MSSVRRPTLETQTAKIITRHSAPPPFSQRALALSLASYLHDSQNLIHFLLSRGSWGSHNPKHTSKSGSV